MAEILSQSEIDALIASLAQTPSVAAAAADRSESTGGRRLRSYDFRRPDKFSKEQLRTLHVIHENFARLLTTYFTATFRTVVQLVVGSVDQSTYQEFMRSVNSPSVLCPFKLEPLEGSCVLDINPVVAFPMLDRMFGGPGSTLPLRELTDIEKTVMTRVAHGILAVLKEAWSNVAAVTPRPAELETNPVFVQALAPNEIVATIAIDVRVGEHVGVITLCIPHMTLEPILIKLSSHNWYSTNRRVSEPADQAIIEQGISRAEVPITVELGAAELSLSELLDLGPGDVIVLGTTTAGELTVYVGGQRKYRAIPGQSRGRLAVEIRGVAAKGEPDYDL